MICNAITRQGYINIMLSTNYGEDMDSSIGCPRHVVSKLMEVEAHSACETLEGCKECWESVLDKVKFRED